jgi:hypothetical protein
LVEVEQVELLMLLELQAQTLQDLDLQLQVVDMVETSGVLVALVALVVVQDETPIINQVVQELLVKDTMVVLILEIVGEELAVEVELGNKVMMEVLTKKVEQLLFLVWEVRVGLLIGQVHSFTTDLVEVVLGSLLVELVLDLQEVED